MASDERKIARVLQTPGEPQSLLLGWAVLTLWAVRRCPVDGIEQCSVVCSFVSLGQGFTRKHPKCNALDLSLSWAGFDSWLSPRAGRVGIDGER